MLALSILAQLVLSSPFLPAPPPTADVDLSIRVFDSAMNFATGAEIVVESPGAAIEHRRADNEGWAGCWKASQGSVSIVTLGQRPVRNGRLLLGQRLALNTPMHVSQSASQFTQQATLSQPIAHFVDVEAKGAGLVIPDSNRLAVWAVDNTTVPESDFDFSAYIGLLPDQTTVDRTQAFFDVQFARTDYVAGADIYVPGKPIPQHATDLEDVGFVLQFNCASYGFSAAPLVTGVVITDDVAAPPSLFELELIDWDGTLAAVWVKGTINACHQFVLLSPPGAQTQTNVHWLRGGPALEVASTQPGSNRKPVPDPPGNGRTAVLAAPTADSALRGTILPSLTTLSAPSIAVEQMDCEEGDTVVPQPTSPSCETWGGGPGEGGAPPEPDNTPDDCPITLQQMDCACSWKPVSEISCGGENTGAETISTVNSWSVHAAVSFEVGPVEVEATGSYESETSVTASAAFTNGAHGHGQCAMVYSGVCVRGAIWEMATDHTHYRFRFDLPPWPKIVQECAAKYTVSTKKVVQIATYTRICDKVHP